MAGNGQAWQKTGHRQDLIGARQARMHSFGAICSVFRLPEALPRFGADKDKAQLLYHLGLGRGVGGVVPAQSGSALRLETILVAFVWCEVGPGCACLPVGQGLGAVAARNERSFVPGSNG